jgi:1,4-alpha-glucan branching enzyme
MPRGYWVPVLHSHLPFVKHPGFEYFLEEHWLFEAISETYIPLLMGFKELKEKGINFKITVSLTPPLCEMLADEYLMGKYLEHLDKMLVLCNKELERTKEDTYFSGVAKFYFDRFSSIKSFFEGFLDHDVLNGYRFFANSGNIEIITCGATHGFLPLMSVNKKAVEVQIALAVETHKKHFGKAPNGIWLPECAYYDGLDEILGKNGIKFFFMDSHGVVFANPTPKFGVFAPIYSPNGVAAFARDPDSSKQVWSSKEGYPGDPNYRDFYRDIGYDLDIDYVKPYICPDGTRVFTGLKYFKITSNSEQKEVYDRQIAMERVKEHASNFHFNREKQVDYLSNYMDRAPMIVSPYDAELFGHWWFEGPEFLMSMFEEMHNHKTIEPITPMEYLAMFDTNQVSTPNPSSWGDKGYYDVWLNGSNDWVYRHLHFMADKMTELADRFHNSTDMTLERILNQMARELLLAQSSDWAFLMTTKTAVEYSTKRTKEHISNFIKLLNMLEENSLDETFLGEVEFKNSIFQGLDFRVYGS